VTAAAAAHVAAREEQALELFIEAQGVAETEPQHREALWGQVMCMAELELDEAGTTLDSLARDVPRDDPREIIREAGRRLGLELRFGALTSLQSAREKYQLLHHTRDALVRTSFRSVFATALNLSADYERALQIASEMLDDAHEHRLDFAVPYGHAAAAAAYSGMRRYLEATEALERAEATARAMSNLHAETNAHALRLRVLLQQGSADAACLIADTYESAPLKGIHGELIASRALALCCNGRLQEATVLLDSIRGTTRAIEPLVLMLGVDAILAIRSRQPSARANVEALLSGAIRSGGIDLLICCYRASPELLAVLLRTPSTQEQMRAVAGRVGDAALIESAGFVLHRPGDPLATLSKREREIYDLVCQGLTYKQIGETLYISEATVKVHMQHVFDKTGVRSRTALAIGAALNRARYAAGAASGGE
jgi:DNA-binding NarL/FixJ family response regulator